jgi:hypothetical protein
MTYDFRNERKITLLKSGGFLSYRHQKIARHDGSTVYIEEFVNSIHLTFDEVSTIFFDMKKLREEDGGDAS